jgi:hypothetical protein
MSTNLRTEPIRSFIRFGVNELKVAAIAQSIGVIVFVSAALIYGLLFVPAPEIEPSVPPAPPIDYQLTPTPANVLPGDKPALIAKRDVDKFAQIVADVKDKMKSAQAGADYTGSHVQFVADVLSPSESTARISLGDANALTPKAVLGRTIDVAPEAIFTIQSESIEDAQGAATKLIDKIRSTSTTSTAPFVAIMRFVPPDKSVQPVSFGLIKTESRLVFTDEHFKVSEVFAANSDRVDILH